MSTETMTPAVAAILTETPAERRSRMRVEASARQAALVLGTKVQALDDRAERQASGFTGREGYVAWTVETRDAIRDALDGATVRLTLGRLAATKRGQRVLVTGVTEAAGHVVAIRGEATLMDWVSDPSGLTVDVRLTARRGERKNGSPFTGFAGESVGTAENGQRVGLRVRVQASRHVRISASAL